MSATQIGQNGPTAPAATQIAVQTTKRPDPASRLLEQPSLQLAAAAGELGPLVGRQRRQVGPNRR